MVNEKITPKAPFSKIAVISILCLTLVTFLGLGWQAWRSNKNVKTFQEQDFRIQELIGTIIHLDEVLTMSARMGTKTGDFKWEERYLKFEPQLGAAISEAKRLVPAAFILKAAIQTDTANTKLVAMEKRAFELVRQGQKEEASAIMLSEEYQGQKQIYAQGMKQVKASMQVHLTDSLNEYKRHEFFTIVTILTVLPVLFFAFIYITLLTRKRYDAERMLSEGKLEKYGMLFDNITDLAYICDAEGNVLFLNKVFEKFSGHKPEKFIGKSFAPLFDGEDLKKAMDLYSRTLNGESPQQEVRFKDTGILCEYNNIPLRDERGNITGVIGTARDITERKRLEDELKILNKTLEQKIVERTAALAKTNEELQKKILQHEKAEESLQKNKEQLQSILDNTSAVIYIKDKDGRYILINRQFEALFHVSCENVIGKTDMDIFPEEMAEAFRANDLKVINAGRPLELEEIAPHDDGPHTYISIKFPIFNSSRIPDRVCGVSTDITERKRAEEELEWIFNLSLDMVGTGNLDGYFTKINPSFERILGYKEEEFLQKPFIEFVYDEDVEKTKETLAEAVKGKRILYIVNRYKCKEGSLKWIEWAVLAIAQENRFLAVGRDITERKREEESLRESEAKYSRLTENLQGNHFFYSHNTDGMFTHISPSITNLLGYTPGEFLTHYSEYMTDSPNNKDVIKYTDLSISGHKQPPYNVELYHKDGSIRTLKIQEVPVFDNNHNVIAVEGIAEDITERKQAVEKLVKYQMQLKRLSSALSLAEEKERRHISEDLHDRIGQALTVIKMKLENIQESQAYTDADGILKDTRELLDQAIQDTRTLTFELSPPVLFELGFEPAVEWLVDQFKKQHNIAIDFVGCGLTEMVEEDMIFFLYKSVRELLFNAIKHARAHRIKVTLLKEDNKIRIDIDDDGIGFDFSNTQFSVEKLNGFGLFSIRERMEHSGGSFNIKSEPGQGAYVTMTMPLKQQEGDADAE